MNIIENWKRRPRVFTTKPVTPAHIEDLNRTQAGVTGFDLARYQNAHVVMVGAGGIGSHVAAALVRKGIGELTLIDDDVVELKNLTRQLFDRPDVGSFKAVALGRRLAADGLFATKLNCHPRRFQELIETGWVPPAGSILIGGVDNNPSRRALSEAAKAHGLPAIHAAVSRDGNALYVMVEEPGRCCWACAFPRYANDRSYPCNLPGIIDVLQVVAGLIVFGVDTVVCNRNREWTVREIVMDGSMPDRRRTLTPVAECATCGVRSEARG